MAKKKKTKLPKYEVGGGLDSAKDGKWIQGAINPKHKGYCTPMSKSTCTPRRKALAKRFKKGGDLHKAELGDTINDFKEYTQNRQEEIDPLTGRPYSDVEPLITDPTYEPITSPNMSMGVAINTLTDTPSIAPGSKKLGRQIRRGQSNNSGDPRYGNPYGMPYHFGMATMWGNEAIDDRASLKQARLDGNTGEIKSYRRQLAGDNLSIAGHSIAGITNTIYDVVAPFAAGFHNMNVDRDERAIRMHQMQNQAQINPYYGDSSELGGGTRSAYAKYGKKLSYGGKLGYLEYGGNNYHTPTMITERGEVTNNTQGVFTENGDLHSDSSGGNVRSYRPGTVVHSDSIGLTVNDALSLLPELPGGEFAATKIAQTYKKGDKKLSFADMAKPFTTKNIDKEIIKIDKKIDKEDVYATSNNETKVSRVTAQLNLKSLAKKAAELQEQKAMNLAITGPDGPLYKVSEDLKQSGAYGKKIQNEAKEAKYGKKLSIAANGDIVTDKFNKFIQKDNKWYYYNGDKLGAEVPSDYRPNGVDDYGSGPAAISAFTTQNPTAVQAAQQSTAPNTWVDPTPAQYRQLAAMEWMGTDEPSAAQKAKGFKKGFNAGIDPKLLVSYLKTAGYTPPNGDWSKVTQKDLQDHVYDWDSKNNSSKIKEYLYNQYLPTIQGLDWFKQKGYSPDTPFYQLDPDDVDKVFKDEKLGIRFGQAAALMGINKQGSTDTPANQPSPVYTPSTFTADRISPRVKRPYYQEGLNPAQIAAPLMDLFTSKQAVPYIEDQGAKRALAASTRQRFTDIQPQLNRITRGVQAITQRRPTDAAANAQVYSNAWEAANQVYGQKYNLDNQIEQNYNNMQNELLMRAGTNKAAALNTLAERTATRDWKDYAMRRNAVGEIGNKYLQNLSENRASVLYQDMFPNFNYNPTIGTQFQGSWAPQVGAMFPYAAPATNNKGYTEERYTDPETGHEIVKRVPTVKYGGKTGKLPKKSPKQR